MVTKNNWSLYAATMLALGVPVVGASAQQSALVSPAQENQGEAKDAANAEVVRVTGSRIVRRDNDTVGPMLTLTKDDIKFSAPTSVGDLLQAMPNVGVSLNSNGTQGTSFGVSSINLRYLGSAEGSGNRTLVLVDGHRWVNATGGRGFRDFVDLNSIPLGMIDHIEVLKDGASAIYGADAIAGVVNIHTRKNLNGVETDLRIGESSRGDGRNVNGYINWGRKLEAGSVFLSASYNDSQAILTADRDATRTALAPLTAAPTSPAGLYVLPGLSNNKYFGTAAGFASNAANAITRNGDSAGYGAGALADNSFHTATLPADYYNTQTQGIYSTGPSRRTGLFGRYVHQLNDDISLRVEAVYSQRESVQLFAPYPLDIRGSNGFSIPLDHPYNPFGIANGVPAAAALGFSGSAFRIQRVPTEVGNRSNNQSVDTARLLVGMDGKTSFYGDWDWDIVLSRSQSKASFDSLNQLNMDHVYLGLAAPAKCAAVAGCVPLNLFGTITSAMADYMRFNGRDTNSTTQTDLTINATRTLAELPGGSLGLATGYEYRKEQAEDLPDAFASALSSVQPLVAGAAQATTTSPGRNLTRGAYHLQEVYAELSAPLLSGLAGIDKLELDAAVRYSRYSTVGGKATSKLGILYRPVSSILARGTYSQGFRAPSILELYQGQRQTNFQTVDPCNGGGAGKPGCAGVPASYAQSQFNGGLTPGVTVGNPKLKPETADTYSLGLVWTPAAVQGLSFNADKFLIKVDQAIAAQTGTQIMQSCANTGNYCELVKRGASGEVLQLSQAVVNLSRIEVAGVDATARYVFPLAQGKVDSALDLSYLEKYRSYVPQSDGSIVLDYRAGKSDQPRSTFPRVKAQASLRYVAQQYSAAWKARYIGHSADVAGNAVNGGTVPGITYQDVQFGYTLPGGKVNLALGIDNLWDKQPPLSAANNPINFDIYTYDVRGRYFYAKVSSKF